MNKTEFNLDGYAREAENLLSETRRIFNKYEDLSLPWLNCNNLPNDMKNEGNPIKLVFVGQYSAGKSSIIKMLSGIDTEIGAGIKTQEAHIYPWNDLEIVDTPGIHTELRPDHDEKTYYEIDHAALLIFVVTNEGFDNRIGNHFRKLAIEQNRAKNMVLVVNKMDRTALGNVPEQQQLIADDLRKVITPYEPEELFISFLDTDSYFSLNDAEDDEEREYYLAQSGREQFIKNLNAFVESRGVLSKLQTPLETLKSCIIKILGDNVESTTDADIDAIEEMLRKKKKTIEDGRNRLFVEIEELVDSCVERIRNEGEKAALTISPGVTEAEAKKSIENAQKNTDAYTDQCMQEIYRCMEEICREVNSDIENIDNINISIKVESNNSHLVKLPAGKGGGIPDGEALLPQAINGAFMGAKDAKKLAFAIPGVGQLNAVGVVKNVGHFFGVKFAPWGAVNLVKGAANVLGWIGIALTAYQILSKVFGEDEDKEMRDNITKAQEEIRSEFDRGAIVVKNSILNAVSGKVDDITLSALEEAEEKIFDFLSKKERLKALNRELQIIMNDVNSLMCKVQLTSK